MELTTEELAERAEYVQRLRDAGIHVTDSMFGGYEIVFYAAEDWNRYVELTSKGELEPVPLQRYFEEWRKL